MDLRERIAKLMSQVRPELAELVAIRSVADPRLFPPDECVRAARWVLDAFAGAGFSDARLAEMADGSQAVLDPAEIAAMALTEALFLQRYADIRS